MEGIRLDCDIAGERPGFDWDQPYFELPFLPGRDVFGIRENLDRIAGNVSPFDPHRGIAVIGHGEYVPGLGVGRNNAEIVDFCIARPACFGRNTHRHQKRRQNANRAHDKRPETLHRIAFPQMEWLSRMFMLLKGREALREESSEPVKRSDHKSKWRNGKNSIDDRKVLGWAGIFVMAGKT